MTSCSNQSESVSEKLIALKAVDHLRGRKFPDFDEKEELAKVYEETHGRPLSAEEMKQFEVRNFEL